MFQDLLRTLKLFLLISSIIFPASLNARADSPNSVLDVEVKPGYTLEDTKRLVEQTQALSLSTFEFNQTQFTQIRGGKRTEAVPSKVIDETTFQSMLAGQTHFDYLQATFKDEIDIRIVSFQEGSELKGVSIALFDSKNLEAGPLAARRIDFTQYPTADRAGLEFRRSIETMTRQAVDQIADRQDDRTALLKWLAPNAHASDLTDELLNLTIHVVTAFVGLYLLYEIGYRIKVLYKKGRFNFRVIAFALVITVLSILSLTAMSGCSKDEEPQRRKPEDEGDPALNAIQKVKNSLSALADEAERAFTTQGGAISHAQAAAQAH